MKKIALILSLLPITAFAETDAGTVLNETISLVRSQCSGISARMENIKKMAGIGTAVNAVGTATGIGGVASGIVKYTKDVEIAKDMAKKEGVGLLLKKLQDKQLSSENQNLLNNIITLSPDIEARLTALASETDEEVLKQEKAKLEKQIKENQDKSTLAGNVRTGLFAVDTATNVAGAVVSSKTVADEDLVEQIKKCTESIDLLRKARARAQFEEKPDLQAMNVSKSMLDKCGEYQYLDLNKINSLAKGAIITNSVGAVSGTVATITSAVGNSKKLSEMDLTTQQGAQEAIKNEKINIASNVLGGVTTAASLTGTALNASQIVEAKKIVNVSQECEEALQW